MLSSLRGPQPWIGGQFGCGVLFRVFLCCVVSVVTMVAIGADIGAHDNYHVY